MGLSWILAETSSEKHLPIHIEGKSIDYYVPTEPMTTHDSIIESITYRFKTREMLW